MLIVCPICIWFFFFKQKTAYEMRISDWSSDVCSSDLALCFADHQICGSRPGLIIKGLRSTYVVRNMHQQVAGIVDQEIADGSPVDCKKQDERQKLRDKAYRLFVDRCRGQIGRAHV